MNPWSKLSQFSRILLLSLFCTALPAFAQASAPETPKPEHDLTPSNTTTERDARQTHVNASGGAGDFKIINIAPAPRSSGADVEAPRAAGDQNAEPRVEITLSVPLSELPRLTLAVNSGTPQAVTHDDLAALRAEVVQLRTRLSSLDSKQRTQQAQVERQLNEHFEFIRANTANVGRIADILKCDTDEFATSPDVKTTGPEPSSSAPAQDLRY